MERIRVGELQIAYRRAGEGPPLVLLHGGVTDSREWRRQIDDLSDEFTVVAWDAPGCGESSDPPERFGLHGYADCLAEFVDALGLGRPHVLGLSFGGGLALELYRRHPLLPRTLLLAGAYAGWAGSLPRDVGEQRLRQALRESNQPPEELVGNWMPTLFSPAAPSEVIDELAAIIADFHPAGVRAMARAFAAADLRDVLPQIDVPTLLVYGELDQRSPLSVAEELHAQIPGSQLVVIPGVGHMVDMQAPEELNAAVRAFLL
jgi:pimeloyl-ACP methyl ester carboxylesterase